MEKIKLCVDCANHTSSPSVIYPGRIWHRCRRCGPEISLVTGEPILVTGLCREERAVNAPDSRELVVRCGPEGKYFKPK